MNSGEYDQEAYDVQDGNFVAELNVIERVFQYQKGSIIASSDYAEVWECLDLTTGERLAVKVYRVNIMR